MAFGTKSLDGTNRAGEYESGVGDTAALLYGAGSTTSQIGDDAVANKNFVGLWTKSTAASGDTRGVYWRQYFNAAGSGEVARLWATVNYNGAAAGGTINALHATMSVNASCAISGAGNAVRATVSAAAATRTLGGTCAALQLDSDVGTGNTVPASWSFVRVTDSGAVRLANLLNIPAAANGTMFAAHTTQTMTHSIKIVDANGTPYYIMCTNAATNRS